MGAKLMCIDRVVMFTYDHGSLVIVSRRSVQLVVGHWSFQYNYCRVGQWSLVIGRWSLVSRSGLRPRMSLSLCLCWLAGGTTVRCKAALAGRFHVGPEPVASGASTDMLRAPLPSGPIKQRRLARDVQEKVAEAAALERWPAPGRRSCKSCPEGQVS
jgi:hypothetical protein